MDTKTLQTLCFETLQKLATEEGFNAAGKDEIYGCIFGRDSALTILKILRVASKRVDDPTFDITGLLKTCRQALLTLVSLQGTTSNPESGEEPGKFIHEFRKDKYSHLLALEKPWYVYPDGFLRNYDSVDSTALTLIAIYKYWQLSSDNDFLIQVFPAVESGLNWMISYGDLDQDTLLEYRYPDSRAHGGLKVQSWTDSLESLLQKDGTFPHDPIAQVEVQGYSWLAMRLWANLYESHHPAFAKKLKSYAALMKKNFNQLFLTSDHNLTFVAQALDGYKQQVKTVTGNPLLLLWATYEENGSKESILETKVINDIVTRSFMPDMFDVSAGLRTMSTLSGTFNPHHDSYHNGSFWPILNSLAYEGLLNWKFFEEANRLKQASLVPIQYFGCPIELYIKNDDGTFAEFVAPTGQTSCREQAWSAAGMLDLVTD
jgi:glycogen debranching enzyme